MANKDDTSTEEQKSKDIESNEYINIHSPPSPIPSSPQPEKDGPLSNEQFEPGVVDSKDKVLRSTSKEGKECEKDQTEHQPEFLRPISTVIGRLTTSNVALPHNREGCEGRITPPPSLISPLPSTPAGSMTPVRMVINTRLFDIATTKQHVDTDP